MEETFDRILFGRGFGGGFGLHTMLLLGRGHLSLGPW
jgi:hypothetical protein